MEANKQEQVRIDSDTKRKLRILAAYNETSMAAHLRQLVEYDWAQFNRGTGEYEFDKSADEYTGA